MVHFGDLEKDPVRSMSTSSLRNPTFHLGISAFWCRPAVFLGGTYVTSFTVNLLSPPKVSTFSKRKSDHLSLFCSTGGSLPSWVVRIYTLWPLWNHPPGVLSSCTPRQSKFPHKNLVSIPAGKISSGLEPFWSKWKASTLAGSLGCSLNTFQSRHGICNPMVFSTSYQTSKPQSKLTADIKTPN